MENNAGDSENLQLNEATALTAIANVNSNNVVGDDAISSTTSDRFIEHASSSSNCDAEADFLEAELSISNIQGEKITENVEDIVQDLENLLGESANSYRFEGSRNESCTEINSTQELHNDKLYESFRNEFDLHLSSREVTSVEKETNEVNAVTKTQEEIENTNARKVEENGEFQIIQSNLLETAGSCIPESAGTEIVEFINSNTSEGIDDVPLILHDFAAAQDKGNIQENIPEAVTGNDIPNVCQILDSEITSIVDNELSKVVDSFQVDSTENIIEDALQTTKEISELDFLSKNIEMEVGNAPEEIAFSQCVQNEDNIAVASIIQEIGDENSSTFYQSAESIEELIPDTSTEVIPISASPPQNTEKTDHTELREPLTVEVEELCSEWKSNQEKKHENIITAAREGLDDCNRSPLKITITKTENIHSILKIYDPTESVEANSIIEHTGRHTLKTISMPLQLGNTSETTSSVIQAPQVLSPLKITIQNIRNDSPVCVSPSIKPSGETYSPKITIKPIVKPDHEESILKSVLEDKLTLADHSNTRKILQTHLERHSPKVPTTLSDYISKDERSVKFTMKPLLKVPDDFQTYIQEKYSPKITIKPIVKPLDHCTEEERPAKIIIKPIPKVEDSETSPEEKHSPKITIKPIRKPEETHTKILMKHILHQDDDQRSNPKITIKPIAKPLEDFESAIDSQRKIILKPVLKPFEQDFYSEDRHSPKITIKPILKPDDYQLEDRHTKITIKQISKSEMDSTEGRHSPKITIKPIRPPEDIQISVDEQHNSKLIIKPIPHMHRLEEIEEKAPRITIKPVLKPISEEFFSESGSNPRITIKPVMKPHELYEMEDHMQGTFKLNIKPISRPGESSLSPKITIKPVPKQEPSSQMELIDFEEQIKQERIVLKIPKNRKNENERVNKIKVKLSKEQGIAQILPVKRLAMEGIEATESKYIKTEVISDVSVGVVSNVPGLSACDVSKNISDINIKKVETNVEDDIVDPLSEIPVFEITLESASTMNTIPKSILPPAISIPPAPRKRGRPRKVPLEVREEFKDPKDEKTLEAIESTRPKRSCRGTSVRATLGIRPRRPRGATRGRVGRPPGSKTKKDRRTYNRKSKDSIIPNFKDFDVKHSEFKHVPLPIDTANNVVIYEEETRMSADNSSRAHTPAKQVLAEGIDESQSSVQSNTTTESGEKLQKIRKGSRLEIHQEPEGEVISADKLAEYSWGGGGPYMLQEQVAQFLGIKSFKRKYPGIHRRTVDMQERDFIRESCLASEAMCDMGLTAVKSEDILDIMYTDFQHKYEEYCKHQRDRQAKDVSNKQKALSLAASQEKNKLDIVEQAVQSAFQWNANFNKARKEQRRACLDLQTFTVHFPKGKMKQINKPSLGLYPVALVPGQYSDYYKRYTSLELSKLPLNTVGRKLITSGYQDTEDSQSDASGSDSDSSSSDSDSSYSGSSVEDCKMCGPVIPAAKKIIVH
ncbi:hypothetical protein RN001_002428 [Aquatica leii]|uniref:PHD finger protein 10 n=1 Tax=Aquatica leii TaxID=1421715 RepID=A0AAN7SK53_9COLE|nr:hypothetical protein RN001_002428 [Aquatica leii]